MSETLPPGFEMTEYGDMCPNCVTPWKCNGPHLQPPGGWDRYVPTPTEDDPAIRERLLRAADDIAALGTEDET